MATIARALSRASGTRVDVETLKIIVILRGAGLVVSLLLAREAAHLGLVMSTVGLDVVNWI
jgi:hypothetical protein